MIFIHNYIWQLNIFHKFFLSFSLTSISYLCLCHIEWPLGSMGTRGRESRSWWTRKGETMPTCFGQAEEKGENAHSILFACHDGLNVWYWGRSVVYVDIYLKFLLLWKPLLRIKETVACSGHCSDDDRQFLGLLSNTNGCPLNFGLAANVIFKPNASKKAKYKI